MKQIPRKETRSPVLAEDAPEKEDICSGIFGRHSLKLPASNLLAASRSNLLHLALRSGLEVGEHNTTDELLTAIHMEDEGYIPSWPLWHAIDSASQTTVLR